MFDYLVECMTIAVKGSIGMVCIIILICFSALILAGAREFLIYFLPKPPEVDRKPTSDVDSEEEEIEFKIIDGGKDNEEL